MSVYFQSKYDRLPGTSFDEILRLARREYHVIQKRNPRRQAHVRSVYFKHDKVFISLFWDHLAKMNRADKLRRLKFYSAAIDLLRHTTRHPEIVIENKQILYRFFGRTKAGDLFCVQVKMEPKSGRKDFVSAFPVKQKRLSAV